MAHGMLVDGVWQTQWHDTKSTGGRFRRTEPKFRNWVTPDGGAGPSGTDGFAAERGRYHLYVSLACPWAHHTAMFRKLKGLEDVISMTEVEPIMGDQGWQFGPDADLDGVNGKQKLNEIYLLAVDAVEVRVRAELPALVAHDRLDFGHRDHVLEALELAEHRRVVRPRTGERNIEVVAAALGRKAIGAAWTRAAVRRYPVAEFRLCAPEPPAGRLGVVPLRLPHAINEHSVRHGSLLRSAILHLVAPLRQRSRANANLRMRKRWTSSAASAKRRKTA